MKLVLNLLSIKVVKVVMQELKKLMKKWLPRMLIVLPVIMVTQLEQQNLRLIKK